MPRLPIDHGDIDIWGALVNEYLLVQHAPDGTHALVSYAPTNLRAVAGDQTVSLTWAAPAIVTGTLTYEVEQALGPGGPWTLLTGTSLLAFTVPGLTNGTVYWYRVQALSNAVGVGRTAAVSATPVAAAVPLPAAPSIAALVPRDRALSTTIGPVAGATSYQVFINTTSSFGATAEVTFPATTTGQTDGYSVTVSTIGGVALTNGTVYFVMARAVNGSGASINSIVQSGTPTATATTFGAAVAAIGYRHWWRLNETSGTALADQASPGPLPLTLSGAATVNQTGLLSDGSGDRAVLFAGGQGITASSTDFSNNGNVSYSVWVTYRRTGANDTLYHALVETANFSLYYNDSSLFWERSDGGHVDVTSTTAPTVGAVEHVLVRYNGSTLSILRNGTLVGSVGSAWAASAGATVLRVGNDQGVHPFGGVIDEVVYFNSYVSDANALLLYQAASGTTGGGGGGGGGAPAGDLHETLTSPPAEVSSGTLATVRAAILATPSGSTYTMPDGIYRLITGGPIHVPAGVRVINAGKRAWIFNSRNWATGGEAGNTWSGPVSGYYTSSRVVPALPTNEPSGVSYVDSAKAQRYEMCVGITAAGVVTRFASIAAGGTPGSGQFCFTSSGTRTIRLGTNPATFARIEVCETSDPSLCRWLWPDGNGVTLSGLVFRYSASGPSADPMGCHDTNNFTITNCVIGDAHGSLVNCGGPPSSNIVITDTLIEYAGNTGLLTYNLNGLNTSRNQILRCGGGGWDATWQGGATKFTVTSNHRCDDNVVTDHDGDGLWWDESCSGPIYINGNLVARCIGPNWHYEISTGPVYCGTERGNCFAYDSRGAGWPVVYVSSSSGPGEIANNLIIASIGRGLQVEWATARSNDKQVNQWYWHDNRFIAESDSPGNSDFVWVNTDASAGALNNRGATNQYYAGAFTTRWTGNSQGYTTIAAWNATAFDEGGQVVSGATAAAWRAAWGI